MRTLLRAHSQKPGRGPGLFIYLFNIAMACRGARGCSAAGARSCSALHSPERHGWEHEKQQSLGWTRTEPRGHVLLPLWLQHDAQEFLVSCRTCMGWPWWLSQRQNACASWELGIWTYIHTVHPQNPCPQPLEGPSPSPWKHLTPQEIKSCLWWSRQGKRKMQNKY